MLSAVLLASAALPTAPSVVVEAAPVSATVALASRPLATGTLTLGAPSSTTTYGTVTAYALNVRSGPGTGYRILTTVYRGTQATVLGRSGSWSNIRLTNGIVGWVSSAYFSVSGTTQVATSTATGVVGARRSMVPNGWFTSGWGAPRSGGRMHEGEDLAARYGSPVYAPARLSIYSNTWNTYGGWTLSGRDTKGRRWYFAHFNNRSWVPVGSTVYKGQVIGYVGSTGNSTGPHLHYGVTWPGGSWANPVDVLRSYPDVP